MCTVRASRHKTLIRAKHNDVPLRLRTPVAVRGDLELSEGVALDAVLLLLREASAPSRAAARDQGEQHTMASAVDENRRVCEARAFSLNCGTRDQSQSEDRGSHGSGGSAARWQNHMSRGCGMASEDRLTKAVARERRSAAILSRN